MPSASVLAGQTPACLWLLTFSSLPTLAALSFSPRLKGSASFHAHATVSATEVSLLPVLVCGTPCRHICDRTRTTDISISHWKETCLGCRRPRRIVVVDSVRLKSSLTYLHTYLLTYLPTGVSPFNRSLHIYIVPEVSELSSNDVSRINNPSLTDTYRCYTTSWHDVPWPSVSSTWLWPRDLIIVNITHSQL